MTWLESNRLRDDLRKIGLTGLAQNIADRSRAVGNAKRDSNGDVEFLTQKKIEAEAQALKLLQEICPGYTVEKTL